MKSGDFHKIPIPADEARARLCAVFAKMLRGGAFRVRVRLQQPLGAAWFYEHHDNTWHKSDVVMEDPALVQAVSEELARVASKPHGDIVQVTHHTASDWQETDMQFQREAIERHLDDQLESYLIGLLFHDQHDSKQDIRRQMRSGPRTGRH